MPKQLNKTISDELKRALNSAADNLDMDSYTVEGGVSKRGLAQMALERVSGQPAKEITTLIAMHGYNWVERQAIKIISN
jgi:hypothetical protein